MPNPSDSARTNSNSNTNIPPKSSRKRRSEIESLEQKNNKSELTRETVLANIIEGEDKSSNSPVTCQSIKRRKEGEEKIVDDLRCEEEFNVDDSPSRSMNLKNTGKETASGRSDSLDDKIVSVNNDEDLPFSFIKSPNCYSIDYDVTSDASMRNPNLVHLPEYYYYGNSYDVIDLMYKKSEIYPKAYAPGKPMVTEISLGNRITILCWLMEIAFEEQQSRITYHLAVNFFDRILSVAKIQPSVYQLLAGACIKLASKIEEVIPITGESLVSKCGDAFSLKQLIKTEAVVTHVLEFSVNPLTTLHFIDLYFRIISFTCDMQSCITPSGSESPLKTNNDDPSISTERDSVNNSPVSSTTSSQSDSSLNNENKVSDDIDHLYFSESPIILQDELIHYYISSAAMADFVTLTNPHLCYDPSKLAAAILYAQFSDFDGYLNFSRYKKEDIEEEYRYIKPFFEHIDKIVEEYKIKYEYLVDQAHKSLEGNRNEVTEECKYRIQTCSLLFIELMNIPSLKDHVEKYENKFWDSLNNQRQE